MLQKILKKISFAEWMIQFAVSDQSKVECFEPEVVVKAEPLVTTYQAAYFYTRSLEEAIVKLRFVGLHSFFFLKIYVKALNSLKDKNFY